MLCSCGGEKLTTPENVIVNIENQLTWETVDMETPASFATSVMVAILLYSNQPQRNFSGLR